MILMQYNDEGAARTCKRAAYIKMVQTNKFVQLSMGSATIEGPIRPMDKHTLRRTDSNGEKMKTIKKSVHAIMRYMRLDGEKVWLSTIPNSDGSVTGNFSSVLDGVRNYVGKWLLCPAAQIYWFLVKKGCNLEDIKYMTKRPSPSTSNARQLNPDSAKRRTQQ